MQVIYTRMTAGSICLLYICIVLDLAVDVVVCKASLLNWLGRATLGVMVFEASMLYWLGVHLPSIYRHCPRPSSGCSSIQGICAPLTGGSICLLYVCIVLDLSSSGMQGIYTWLTGRATWSVMVCKASMLYWLGGHLPSLYMYCPRSSFGCSGMHGICAQLTGGSICLLYRGIVLDPAVGAMVCKASLLN